MSRPGEAEGHLAARFLEPAFDSLSIAEKWVEILDNVNAGEMPPEGEPRPDKTRQTRVIEWIEGELAKASKRRESTGGRVVMRRLNRDEYNRTVRTLTGVNFNPGRDFPEDPPAHGFDNIGAALEVSPMLMEKYLKAARDVVGRALVTGERPERHHWQLEVEEGHRSNQFDGRDSAGRDELWLHDHVQRHRYLLKGGGLEVRSGFVLQKGSKSEGAAGFRWFKFPVEGLYRLRIRAAGRIPGREEVVASVKKVFMARHATDDWKDDPAAQEAWLREEWPEIREHFLSDPIYHYSAPRMKVTTDEGIVIREVSVDAEMDEPHVYEFFHRFGPRHRNGTDGVNIRNQYHVPRLLENHWFQADPEFARPELFIDWMEIEGPWVDEWPPLSHQRLVGEPRGGESDVERARRVLEDFMERAYRRPLREHELDRMVALFEKMRPAKPSFVEAIKVPLIATLVSPAFLFLLEPNEKPVARPLNDYELASRLSYFLWSDMPDDELFHLAQEGRLGDAATLRAQVDRMLADKRSEALVRNFTGQWLGLREVGANPPVETLFPHYDDHLERSMVGESEAFFAEMLYQDHSVLNFLRADFVTVNARMARFYGMKGVRGDHFRRVAAPVNRGGLLTQASILTITSNGTRTSPVVRGAWILENLLGDPPPPPPPDAGDLAPEVPGIDKATVRDRLEAHRAIAECARCHDKIDPLGFALENYHADGRWRDQYGFGYNGRAGRQDPIVDASGQLPDGRTFSGVDALQELLLEEEDRFLRCLTEKILTYALGRGLEYSDRGEVDRLTNHLKTNRYALRSLIKAIATSHVFQSK